jgi:hypothetical protein
MPDQWPPGTIFAGSVDGVHFKAFDPMHPTLPFDKAFKSPKFKRAGFAYDLFISLFEQKLYHIGGPFPAGTNDKTMWKLGANTLIPEGMVGLGDLGYIGAEGVSVPNKHDSKNSYVFKRRARARHESFNARIKNFAITDHTFRLTRGIERERWRDQI